MIGEHNRIFDFDRSWNPGRSGFMAEDFCHQRRTEFKTGIGILRYCSFDSRGGHQLGWIGNQANISQYRSRKRLGGLIFPPASVRSKRIRDGFAVRGGAFFFGHGHFRRFVHFYPRLEKLLPKIQRRIYEEIDPLFYGFVCFSCYIGGYFLPKHPHSRVFARQFKFGAFPCCFRFVVLPVERTGGFLESGFLIF